MCSQSSGSMGNGSSASAQANAMAFATKQYLSHRIQLPPQGALQIDG